MPKSKKSRKTRQRRRKQPTVKTTTVVKRVRRRTSRVSKSLSFSASQPTNLVSSMRMEHRGNELWVHFVEPLSSINTSPTWINNTYPVGPRSPYLTRLQLLGYGYQRYKFAQLTLRWVPGCPVTTSGDVGICILTDANATTANLPTEPADCSAAGGRHGAVYGKYECTKYYPDGEYPFMECLSAPSSEFGDMAKLIVGVTNGPSTNVNAGYAVISGTIRFREQIMPPPSTFTMIRDDAKAVRFGADSKQMLVPFYPTTYHPITTIGRFYKNYASDAAEDTVATWGALSLENWDPVTNLTLPAGSDLMVSYYVHGPLHTGGSSFSCTVKTLSYVRASSGSWGPITPVGGNFYGNSTTNTNSSNTFACTAIFRNPYSYATVMRTGVWLVQTTNGWSSATADVYVQCVINVLPIVAPGSTEDDYFALDEIKSQVSEPMRRARP